MNFPQSSKNHAYLEKALDMLHQAWSDGSFFPIINQSAACALETGATLVWTIEATTWHEAMTRYHEMQGWKPYVPLDDDPGAYTADEEAEAARLIAAEKIGVAKSATDYANTSFRGVRH